MAVSEAFLLCGGSSRRLGFPKEMLRVDGVPLAIAMARRLQQVFPRVAVVTNRPAYLEPWLDAPVHEDAFPGLGPLAGVHTGLKCAERRRAFFLGCDMPLVTADIMRRVARAGAGTDAPVVLASTPSGPEPLCGVYDTSLLTELEERLRAGQELSARDFVRESGAARVELEPAEAGALRDVDRPADLGVLRCAFGDVDPLPTRRERVTRVGGRRGPEDVLVEERSCALAVNGVRLVTLLCVPMAVRELAVGFLAYLGLLEPGAEPPPVHLDRDRERVDVELDVSDEELRRTLRLRISSTCGAGLVGGEPPRPEAAGVDNFHVSAEHILAVLRRLRAMAPIFQMTGATHQAAFTDGRRVLHFEEDVGRHNAVDKVLGRCLIEGTDTHRGALLVTGRLNAEMVIKALRQRVPVAASRGAATARAVELARERGVTVVGFARGDRMNICSAPERIEREAT